MMVPKKSLFSCIHFSTCASEFWGAVSPITPLFLCRLNPTLPNSPIPTLKPRPVISRFWWQISVLHHPVFFLWFQRKRPLVESWMLLVPSSPPFCK